MEVLDDRYEENKTLYKCRVKDIVDKLHLWSKNRRPDISRVRKIKTCYSEFSPNIIYTWKKADGRLYIYDGAHRWEAIKTKPDAHIWLAVLETPDETVVEREFAAMNSAVPVPELYLQPDDSVKILIVEFVAGLASKFNKLSSASRNPHKPSFNRDVLTDLLYDALQSETDLNSLSFDTTVLDLESQYSDACMIGRIKEKCVRHDCHLFAFGMSSFVADLKSKLQIMTTSNETVAD